MAKQTVDVGTSASDGTGDDLRVAFTKINENFSELYSGNVQVTAANVRVYSVAGRDGNVVLTVNDIAGGVSKAYVNAAIAANIANVSGATYNSINANVAAANLVISNHSARITTLESNAKSQALQINSLVSVKANVSYVDTSISYALSNSAIAANLTVINANITAANAAIAVLQANAATQAVTLNTLTSNAASQAVLLNTLLSNAASQGATLTTLTSNAASQSSDISVLQSNAGAQATSINTLTANAASQSVEMAGLRANINAANAVVASFTSNASSQALDINNLWSNAGAQSTILNALTSNAATQSQDIGTLSSNVNILLSNAASQAVSLTTLTSNAATQATSINAINANVGAYQFYANTNISALLANAGTQSSEISALTVSITAANANVGAYQVWSNANSTAQATSINSINANVGAYQIWSNANSATQATSINSINSNIGAYQIWSNTNAAVQSGNISTLFSLFTQANAAFVDVYSNLDIKANIFGQVFDGNVQAPYLIANANVQVGNAIKVGSSNPINYPRLAGAFTSNVNGYYQLVLQNKNSGSTASGDIVITADDGNDSSNFIDIGINSSTYNRTFEDSGVPEFPHDGYLQVVGGNAAIRTTGNIIMNANASIVALAKDGPLVLFNTNLQFSDFSVQSTAIRDVPGLYANLGTATTNITTLFSNAATQATSINTINANIGAYQIFANTGTANVNTTGNVTASYVRSNGNIAMTSNVARNVYVNSYAPASTQGNVGDIWYQTF